MSKTILITWYVFEYYYGGCNKSINYKHLTIPSSVPIKSYMTIFNHTVSHISLLDLTVLYTYSRRDIHVNKSRRISCNGHRPTVPEET